VPLEPAGVARADCTVRFCWVLIGRPLRIGAISGSDACDGRSDDLILDMPIKGGDATSASDVGNCSYRLVSDCVLFAYMSCIGQSVFRINDTSFAT
jgi:hypothetical protein